MIGNQVGRISHLLLVFGVVLQFAELIVSSVEYPDLDVNHLHHSPSIIVSTIDGKISALSIHNNGKLIWVNDCDSKPLVSSSIAKLIYKQDGKPVRIVPSLNGGLFRFDGDTVEAVPFDSEQLLSSSFRLAADSLLIGGKELSSTGIDAQTGRTVYSCSSSGCEQQQKDKGDQGDVIVVKKNQKTVRLVQNRNGAESWNFSVGEVNLDVAPGRRKHLIGSDNLTPDLTTSLPFQHHPKEALDEEQVFTPTDFPRIKVMVPDGTICMVASKGKPVVQWKHKFASPITAAWVLLNGKLHKLDLFDPVQVPALEKERREIPSSNTIYLGVYESHAYIQSTPSVNQAVAQTAQTADPGAAVARYTPPKFTYRPTKSTYYITAKVGDDAEHRLTTNQPPTGKELKMYTKHRNADEAPSGTYFHGDISYFTRIEMLHKSRRKGRSTIIGTQHDNAFKGSQQQIAHEGDSTTSWLPSSIIITFLVVTISVLAQVILRMRGRERLMSSGGDRYELPPAATVEPPANLSTVEVKEFQSRFLQDFQVIECLGKGGFGVVFKALNRMDDCNYAVKRILLPRSTVAREKVLREVRALAILDHPSIVRYFNAWHEEPPAGWQHRQDQELQLHCSSLMSSDPMAPSLDVDVEGNSPATREQVALNVDDDDVMVFGGRGNTGALLSSDDRDVMAWSRDDDWGDDSGRFSVLRRDDDVTSDDCSKSCHDDGIPFANYRVDDDTMSIVFEHSDEGKKEDKSVDEPVEHEHSVYQIGTTTSNTMGDAATSTAVVKTSSRVRTSSKHAHDSSCMYLYIQMQLCKRESLREWLLSHVADRDHRTSLSIFRQVVGAVQYVHREKLIHRDLKPSNVLFSLNGTVKVGDFGLVTDAGDDALMTSSQGHVSAGGDAKAGGEETHTQRVGTQMYMAPEQMSSKVYSDKVDIFALGLILFELCNPFETQMERIRKLTDVRNLRFPTNFQREYPVEAEVVLQLLQEVANDRPSASQLLSHPHLFSQLAVSQSDNSQPSTSPPPS